MRAKDSSDDEEIKMLDEVQKELEKCYAIAMYLDSKNPEASGAFVGTPSERITNQLKLLGVFE